MMANRIGHPGRDDDQCHDLSATELAPGGATSRADVNR